MPEILGGVVGTVPTYRNVVSVPTVWILQFFTVNMELQILPQSRFGGGIKQ